MSAAHDIAPWEDELREAERDARAAAVFFDRPDERPSRDEIALDEHEAARDGGR
jgi:hypothetical protein